MRHTIQYQLYTFMITAALSVSFCLQASAQYTIECSKLLKRDISKDSPQQVLSNFKQVRCFGLDSIDSQLLLSGPILGSLMVNYVTKHPGKVTYSDILAEIKKSKSDTGYSALRKLKIAQNTLEATKGSAETWERSKSLLLIVGMPENEMENFHQYVLLKQARGWNYRQLVTAYQMKMADEKKPGQ